MTRNAISPAPLPILTASNMRAAEAATAAAGTSLATLMDRAGEALGRLALRVASGRPLVVFAGPGNNGGDGYVAARWLAGQGADVTLVAASEPRTDLARAAATHWTGQTRSLEGPAQRDSVLLDCLFGTGLDRPLDDELAGHLARHAAAAVRTIAADLPSGLATDTGALLGCPYRADVTLAFGALKPAHVLFPGAGHCGQVELATIGICASSALTTLAPPHLAMPDATDHKYTRGLVAVVAGAMGAAAELAARAAARSGAGYVRLIGSGLPPAAPFAIVRQGWRDGEPLADARIGAIVIGPGLGSGEGAQTRLDAALATGKPLVLDADALTLLEGRTLAQPAILTPHAGEFARLAPGVDTDKISTTRALAARSGAVLVHKGADTVIAAPDGRAVVAASAPAWLATAGTGDVLAGIAGAMLARGVDPFDAACAAVWLHIRAARRAGPGLCADDLFQDPIWP